MWSSQPEGVHGTDTARIQQGDERSCQPEGVHASTELQDERQLQPQRPQQPQQQPPQPSQRQLVQQQLMDGQQHEQQQQQQPQLQSQQQTEEGHGQAQHHDIAREDRSQWPATVESFSLEADDSDESDASVDDDQFDDAYWVQQCHAQAPDQSQEARTQRARSPSLEGGGPAKRRRPG